MRRSQYKYSIVGLTMLFFASTVFGQTGFNQNGSDTASANSVQTLSGWQAQSGGGGVGTDCSTEAGADAGAKITACITAAASGSKVADATKLTGAQSAAASFTVSAGVVLLIGNTTLTMASGQQIILNSGAWLDGSGRTVSKIVGNVSGDGVVANGASQGNVHISHIYISNSDSTDHDSSALHLAGSDMQVWDVDLRNGYYTFNATSGYRSYLGNVYFGTAPGTHFSVRLSTTNGFTINQMYGGGSVGCIDLENVQGVTVTGADCEGSGDASVVTGLDGPTAQLVQATFVGGYFQPANGAYQVHIGQYTQGTALIVFDHPWFWGFNNGCTSDIAGNCQVVTSFGNSGPTNNGAMRQTWGASNLYGGGRSLGLIATGAGLFLSDPANAWQIEAWSDTNGLGITPTDYDWTHTLRLYMGLRTEGLTTAESGIKSTGTFTSAGLPDPVTTAWTVTPKGTAGSTTYNYYVVCKDGQGETSNVMGPITTTTGNAVLDGTNYNHLFFSCGKGYLTADVLLGDSIHSVAINLKARPNQSVTYDDKSGTTSAYTPSSGNTTDVATFAGPVTIGGGSNILYRCNGGTNDGNLTMSSGGCSGGTAVDTGLRVK